MRSEVSSHQTQILPAFRLVSEVSIIQSWQCSSELSRFGNDETLLVSINSVYVSPPLSPSQGLQPSNFIYYPQDTFLRGPTRLCKKSACCLRWKQNLPRCSIISAALPVLNFCEDFLPLCTSSEWSRSSQHLISSCAQKQFDVQICYLHSICE